MWRQLSIKKKTTERFSHNLLIVIRPDVHNWRHGQRSQWMTQTIFKACFWEYQCLSLPWCVYIVDTTSQSLLGRWPSAFSLPSEALQIWSYTVASSWGVMRVELRLGIILFWWSWSSGFCPSLSSHDLVFYIAVHFSSLQCMPWPIFRGFHHLLLAL